MTLGSVEAELVALRAREAKYRANSYCGVRGEGENYQVIQGAVPVLLSAPHSVKQWRDGRLKVADGNTGSLVEYLCERYGTFGLVRQWLAADDPNYGEGAVSAAYREAASQIVYEWGIRLVLDLHGCKDEHGFEVIVGTNEGRNLKMGDGIAARVPEILARHFERVAVDYKFKAAGKNTVSNWVHRRTGVSCLQLEWATAVRTTEAGVEQLAAAVGEIVDNFR